jgi:radical SAM protein (TIGR01212 family)
MDERVERADWNGQRYFPVSSFYRQRFGEKVYKISVATSETCPVRNASNNAETCIFCDKWGAAASRIERSGTLEEKISIGKEKIAARYRAKAFLVYFQPYTSTFERVSVLQSQIETALAQPNIVGVVLGTRPDCLPQKIFPMLRDLNEQSFVSIELGAQSFVDARLQFLKRGHTAQQTIDAVTRLYELSGVDVGAHLMLGLPDETQDELVEMASVVNGLPLSNVKLHNLHVLKDTPLETMFQQNEFTPVTLEQYCNKAIVFLRHLSQNVCVHRLTAVASRWDELVAPQWSRQKMLPVQYILDEMKHRDVWQGDLVGK